jgi:hypothetical protein
MTRDAVITAIEKVAVVEITNGGLWAMDPTNIAIKVPATATMAVLLVVSACLTPWSAPSTAAPRAASHDTEMKALRNIKT